MFNGKLPPDYEINPQTLAILPQTGETGTLNSLVMEEDTKYIVNISPYKLVDATCNFFGSSLRGRQDGTRVISGITHKAPIAIDPSSGMYFFPTTSPVNKKCIWIAHSHIEVANRAPNNQTEVIFKNGKKIIVDVSYGSMMNQIQRAAQFRYLLDQRIKSANKLTAIDES